MAKIIVLEAGAVCTFVTADGEFVGYYYPIPGTDSFAAQTTKFVHNVFPDVWSAIHWLTNPTSLVKEKG